MFHYPTITPSMLNNFHGSVFMCTTYLQEFNLIASHAYQQKVAEFEKRLIEKELEIS